MLSITTFWTFARDLSTWASGIVLRLHDMTQHGKTSAISVRETGRSDGLGLNASKNKPLGVLRVARKYRIVLLVAISFRDGCEAGLERPFGMYRRRAVQPRPAPGCVPGQAAGGSQEILTWLHQPPPLPPAILRRLQIHRQPPVVPRDQQPSVAERPVPLTANWAEIENLLDSFFQRYPDDAYRDVARDFLGKLVANSPEVSGRPGGWAGGLVYAISAWTPLRRRHVIRNAEYEELFGTTMGTIRTRAERIWQIVEAESARELLASERFRDFSLRDEANANAICAYAFRNYKYIYKPENSRYRDRRALSGSVSFQQPIPGAAVELAQFCKTDNLFGAAGIDCDSFPYRRLEAQTKEQGDLPPDSLRISDDGRQLYFNLYVGAHSDPIRVLVKENN